jgi:hypothetical protein
MNGELIDGSGQVAAMGVVSTHPWGGSLWLSAEEPDILEGKWALSGAIDPTYDRSAFGRRSAQKQLKEPCKRPRFTSFWKGFRPGAIIRYKFVEPNPAPPGAGWAGQTPTDIAKWQGAISQALQLWTDAMARMEIFTSFVHDQAAAPPVLQLVREPIVVVGKTDIGGQFGSTADGDGLIDGGKVSFTSDTKILNAEDGFLKVALHEIDHGLGLDDEYGSRGSSVMNQLSAMPGIMGTNKANDPAGNAPTEPAFCDAYQARKATMRPFAHIETWISDFAPAVGATATFDIYNATPSPGKQFTNFVWTFSGAALGGSAVSLSGQRVELQFPMPGNVEVRLTVTQSDKAVFFLKETLTVQ